MISTLESIDGTHKIFRYPLVNGKLKGIIFCDVNGTYVWLHSIIRRSISIVFPWVTDVDSLVKNYLRGFKLGTSWREFYRMYGIYVLGINSWTDPLVYGQDFLDHHKQEIDQPGSEYYEIANRFLQTFDLVASEVVKDEYLERPKSFADMRIKPINHLANIWVREGYLVVGMSANPIKYIQQVCKYAGLAQFFPFCVTDTHIFGLKEYKMDYFTDWLESQGIPVPFDKVKVVGDSLTGDIQSLLRFKWLEEKDGKGPVSGSGLLVLNNEGEFKEVIQKVRHDSDLSTMTKKFSVEAILLDHVPLTDNIPQMDGPDKKKFIRKIEI